MSAFSLQTCSWPLCTSVLYVPLEATFCWDWPGKVYDTLFVLGDFRKVFRFDPPSLLDLPQGGAGLSMTIRIVTRRYRCHRESNVNIDTFACCAAVVRIDLRQTRFRFSKTCSVTSLAVDGGDRVAELDAGQRTACDNREVVHSHAATKVCVRLRVLLLGHTNLIPFVVCFYIANIAAIIHRVFPKGQGFQQCAGS